MHDFEALANRLRKTQKTRKKWAQREGTEAYRLYEMDIPELRYIVDVYLDHAVVYDRRGNQEPDSDEHDTKLVEAVAAALSLPLDHLHLKRRRRMQGAEQYGKLGESRQTFAVREGEARYVVNLDDYLDTGLFLDHRPLRKEFRRLPPGTRFLNLFCYTGAVSVAAAQSGARTVSVDMSNTYVEWAKENFRLNGLELSEHRFVREDCLRFLAQGPAGTDRFDVVFLDPPSYSTSKKMTGDFDIQRDHPRLIDEAVRFLAPGGRLFFSTNRLRFVLDAELAERYQIEDITPRTIPDDFRNQQIHRCFVVTRRP